MQKIITLLLSTLLLHSCKVAHNGSPIQQSEIVFELQKGACYGTCPIYTYRLNTDRKVTYHGKRFVEHQGLYEWYIDKKSYKAILKCIENKFRNLNTFHTNAIDLQKTTISFFGDTLQYQGVCPDEINTKLDYIEMLLFKNAVMNFPE